MPFSARMQIVLTNASATPSTVNIDSEIKTIHPPSTYNTNIGIVEALPLNATFDASSFSGLWNMSVRVIMDDGSGPVTDTYKEFDVTFSDYIANYRCCKAHHSPGDSTTLFYTVKNIGSTTDSFTISVSSTRLGRHLPRWHLHRFPHKRSNHAGSRTRYRPAWHPIV